jgi:hypothetical protein
VAEISSVNVPHTPLTVLRPPRVARLNTVAAWAREVGLLYRSMRRGEMPSEIGSRLAYVARVGAELTRIEEQLREAVAIEAQLRRMDGAPVSLERPRVALDADGAAGEVAAS